MDIEAVRLPDEEINKVTNPYIVPTDEQWEENADHEYWRMRRLIDAQTRHLIELGWGPREPFRVPIVTRQEFLKKRGLKKGE